MSCRTVVCCSTILRRFALMALLVSGTATAGEIGSKNPDGVIEVSAEQLIELAEHTDRLVIIDSRLPGDVKRGRIERSLNLPSNEMSAEKLAQLARRDQPVLFYCNGRRCPRSHDASAAAVSWGWQQVYWFQGGIEEWVAKNYPLVVVSE
jgi:rhodanese-related sulfurtransferase